VRLEAPLSNLDDDLSLRSLPRLLLGSPGLGKTQLAVALAVSACQNGYSMYFTTLEGMIRALAAADPAGRLDSKLRTYTGEVAAAAPASMAKIDPVAKSVIGSVAPPVHAFARYACTWRSKAVDSRGTGTDDTWDPSP